jgi:hypothetical protein
MKKAYEQFTTGAPRHPGIPCATVLTVSFVLIGYGTGRGSKDDLPDGQSEIFLREGVDSRIGVDLAGENRFFAQWFAPPLTQ